MTVSHSSRRWDAASTELIRWVRGTRGQQLHRDAVVLLGEARLGELQLQLRQHLAPLAISASACSPSRAVMSSRMRWISACSSSSSRTRSLFCSMVSSGSMKTVWPLDEAPCATPCTRRRCSTFTGNHEALAANGDQLVLHGAAFGKPPQIGRAATPGWRASASRCRGECAPVRARRGRRACRRAGSCCGSGAAAA